MSKKKELTSVDFFKDTSAFDNKYLRWIEQNPHRFLILVITLIGFIYRLIFAMGARGILHADEIYQGLEMGHKIAFGSGIIPPEFRNDYQDVPSYAASRSWTFPLIFGMIMRFFDILGLDYFTVTLPAIKLLLAVNSTLLIISSRKLAKQITNNQNVELFTTVFIALWYRLIDFTVRSFTNTFFLPILFYSIYRILINLENDNISKRDHVIVIFGIGISTYNRLDLFIIIIAFFIISFNGNKINQYLKYALDTMFGWIICLIVDFYYYKEFKIPPLNWFKFNLIENNSDNFLVNSWDYYIDNLINLDGLKPFVLFSFLLMIISASIIKYHPKSFNQKDKNLIRNYYRLFFATMFVWITYTSFWRNLNLESLIAFFTKAESWEPQSHKEIRFIIGGLVVLLIYISVGLEIAIIITTRLLQWILIDLRKIKNSKFLSSEIKHWTNIILPLFLILIISLQSVTYGNSRQYIEGHTEINIALEYVGKQNDTSGVIVGVIWYQSGGYTYSHLTSDVPMVFVNFQDNDAEKLRIYKLMLANYLQEASFNYFIVPDYQFKWNLDLQSDLYEFDWKLIKIIDGTVQIWKRI